MTEKTRICFRDALYRLADNSKGNHVTQSQDRDLAIEEPSSWADHDETTRYIICVFFLIFISLHLSSFPMDFKVPFILSTTSSNQSLPRTLSWKQSVESDKAQSITL